MALDALLQALGAVGTVVDTPASVLRGLLAGQGGRAMGGIFDPEQRVSGSEMLGLDPNAALFSGEGIAGLGAEMALDPLNLIGGLGLLKGARAAKAAKASNTMRDELLSAFKGTSGKTPKGAFFEATVPDSEIADVMRKHYMTPDDPLAGLPDDVAKLSDNLGQAMEPRGSFMWEPNPSLVDDLSRPASQSGIGDMMPMMGQPNPLGAGTAGVPSVGPLSGQTGQFSIPYPGQMPPSIQRPPAALGNLTDKDWVNEAIHWLDDPDAGIPEVIQGMFRQGPRPRVPDFQQVPSISPLLAALGAHNLGRTGAYSG